MSQQSRSVKQVFLEYLLPFLGLASICVINSLLVQKIFAVSSGRYLEWYISAGPFISLALAAFGAAWDALDNNVGLVSANPRTYIIACAKLAGLPILAFGGHLKPENHQGMNLWDVVVGIPLILLFVVASFAWLLLVAPLQYFLFLVCGAPSRIALSSKYRLHAQLDDKILNYGEFKPHETEQKGVWDASMRHKPVTMANAFGAVVLFITGYVVAR